MMEIVIAALIGLGAILLAPKPQARPQAMRIAVKAERKRRGLK